MDILEECWMLNLDDEDDILPELLHPPKRAKRSLHEKFPELPSVVDQYVRDNSAEAHNRRRNATAYSNGVSLRDIQHHVMTTVPGLNSISLMTIHRLMKPARRGTRNANRHVGIVDARIPAKQNNQTNEHPDFHYTSAAVNYINELVTMCSDECVAFSCDDKNKINVGTLAVSRHFQLKKFFSTTDAPNYPDHDFPFSDSKIIPSGYMRLSRRKRRNSAPAPTKRKPIHRTRSASPGKALTRGFESTPDKMGREQISWPRTGPLDVFLQAAKFHRSTSQAHCEHLYQLLLPILNNPVSNPSVVSIVADGGPDWNTKSLVNLINFGRLWRDLKLDGLVVVAYAPRHSRYNPVERAWAPLSKWLAGVTLPRTLPGENLPPPQQTSLTDADILQKEFEVFDNAIDTCAKYWRGKKYDGFPITIHSTPSNPTQQPTRYEDHTDLKALISASGLQISKSTKLKTLQTELCFFLKHCVRRTYQLEFYKCTETKCDYCSAHPVKATNFFDIIDNFDRKMPAPTRDPARRRGEYLKFLELVNVPTLCGNTSALHESLPSGDKEACSQGCRYIFASAADRKRHDILVHRRR